MSQFHLLLLMVLSCSFVTQSSAANILLIPLLNASHFLEMDGVGRPLVQRGHSVYVLLDQHTMMPKAAPYQLVTFSSSKSPDFITNTQVQHRAIENSKGGINISMMTEAMRTMCEDMMKDQQLLPKLRSLKLDLVILDNGPAPCFYLVPYLLGVPYVAVGSALFSWVVRVPLLPSVVKPAIGLEAFGIRFCEESADQWTVVRSLCRTASTIAMEYFFVSMDSEYLRKYVQFSSITEIRENASLTLVNSAHYLSTPLPKLPHVEYVGGLTTRPPKPLEASLDRWMSEARNVVVVSFGSMFGSLPPAVASKLFEAFGKLNQLRFLFRFKQSEVKSLNVPVNVRLMDWLPQNDALGHNSTLAFVTHSGNNGQQEALYHGVPMLCFYVHGDQINNAKRVADRGFGKMISIHDFTVEQLVSELSDLIHNSSYTERIKKASQMFHSEKHPSERAADAVEHVLKYGSDHLRPNEAYKLNFWQFYMLDVLAIVYLVTVLVLVVVAKVLKCALCYLLRTLTASKQQKAKTE